MPDDGLDAERLPVVLRQSAGGKLKAAVVGAWYAFMVAVGGVLVAGAGADTSGGSRVMGAVICVVSAPLALYWLLQLLPGACRLTVARDGLHVRHCFLSRKRRWEDVGSFYVRTQQGYRMPDWHGVAFQRRDRRPAGVGSWLEGVFRVRGIFDTDLLPDTYGVGASRLGPFLNECDRRWSGEKASAPPREVKATRALYVMNSILLLAFASFFLLGALGGAADGDWGGALLMAAFASPFLYALTKMVKRWRNPTIDATQR